MDEHSVEIIDLELAILLRRLTSITTGRKIGKLDRSAYLLLHQISSQGPTGVKALADEFRLDISTVSRQVAALEQKGYVCRIPDPLDGRAYSLQITELGIEEFNDYKNARLSKLSEILKNWSSDERRVFGQLLRKYNLSVIDQ